MKTLLVALVSLLTFAAPALAGSTSITLNEADPHAGDTVTFTVESRSSKPLVIDVYCRRDGVLVYAATSRPVDDTFVLTTGGEADCEAVVGWEHQTPGNANLQVLAKTTFHVAA